MASKPKKLKQARLSFGQVKELIEEKENILSSSELLNKAKENENTLFLNNEGVVFNSILRKNPNKALNDNQIEVKVDVHQTIQCPEVSTSSIESEAEKSFEEIDSNEDKLVCNDENSPEATQKITEEASKNIDAVIDSVIERGLNDAESLFSNIGVVRDRRKRHAQSPCSENQIVSNPNSILPVSSSQLTSEKSAPMKKPRRSILDMLSVSIKESQPSNPEKGFQELSTNEDNNQTKVDERVNVDIHHSQSNSSATTIISVETEDNEKIDCHPTNDHGHIQSASKNKVVSPNSKPGSITPEIIDSIDLTSDIADSKIETAETQTCNNKVNKKKSPNPKTKVSRKSAEMIKEKEDKEREREEKRKQKEEEKRLREKERFELKQKREEERLHREEEKRKKKEEADKLKDEKQKKKQEELEKKKAELEAKKLEKEKREEEKKREREMKEAEKRAKEEEKQKILQEKAKIEEEKKRVAEKQATSFKSFFTPPPKTAPAKKSVEKAIGSFIPFQLKEDMFLSPRPAELKQEAKIKLEEKFKKQKLTAPSYLDELKVTTVRRCLPRTIPRQKPKLLSLSDDGLEILPSSVHSKSTHLRVKLLQFSENVRPPYYGTWKKKSKKLKARNPFQKDEDLLDYDVDSEAEWEDVGEGEDIANSDGEEEGGTAEDEEDDADGFFVPHGYLSDDEGINEEEEDMKEERSDQKLKMKQQEFENSFKQKIKVLTPLTIGCVWEENKESFSVSHLAELQKYVAQFFVPGPINVEENQTAGEARSESKTPSANRKGVPEEAIPDLIRMLHGNPHRISRLIPEFQEYWRRKNTNTNESSNANNSLNPPRVPSPERSPNTSATPSPRCSPYLVSGVLERSPFFISKTQLQKKIKEIGIYARKENLTRSCWLVLDAVFEKYSLDPSQYPIPCKWDYITFEPDVKLYPAEIVPPSSEPRPIEAPVKGNIHKFASKVSAETLLEKSKMKLDQEKENKQPVQALEKFATTKITPEKLLETSRQKIEREEMKQKRRISLTTISLAPGKDADAPGPFGNPDANDEFSNGNSSFGVPSHDAFKSFFKVKEQDQVDSQPDDKLKENMANQSDGETPMEVSSEKLQSNHENDSSSDNSVEHMKTET